MTRTLLAAAAIGTLTGLALTFGPRGALGVAVCAAGVIVWGLVRAVRADKRRARDKARHPASIGSMYLDIRMSTGRTPPPPHGLRVIKGGKP